MESGNAQAGDAQAATGQAWSAAGPPCATTRLVTWHSDLVAWLDQLGLLRRGRGLGVALVDQMIENGPGRAFRWMLHTADAHDLYRRFGFDTPDSTYLERPNGHGQ